MEKWIIAGEEDGLEIMEAMQRRLPAAPGGYLRQLLRAGKVRRDGVALSPTDIVRGGDIVNLPASKRLRCLMESAPGRQTPILFESREIVVVYKPAGLAVHRGVGHEEDNLVRRVNAMMQARRAPFRTAPVHRLDVETSGPVIFGKGRAAIARLGQLFMAEKVVKTYVALVAGRPDPEGTLATPVPMRGKLKAARTLYRIVAGNERFTLLELDPKSGRTHQIRRQLASAGHPLAGDRRYGGPELPGLERLFLHCSRLQVTDPFRDAALVIESPLPAELGRVLGTLGFAPSGDLSS